MRRNKLSIQPMIKSQDFTRSKSLNLIPSRKLQDKLDSVEHEDIDPSIKLLKLIAINRYAESNIPIDYWHLKMEKDFSGPQQFLKVYQDITSDLKQAYFNGASICFAGGHGIGKTFTATSTLKKAADKGYTCLYTTISDAISALTQSDYEEKHLSRRELCMVDFLTLDELDPRFMSSESSVDLYARTLETIFRTRSQNKLPTIICTNSPNVVESFTGALKASIGSLMKGYLTVVPALGEDYRKRIKE